MTSKYFVVPLLAVVIALLPGVVFAQTSGSLPEEGIGRGGYTIRQSMEVGYRFTDQTGSGSMYDTLVNLQSGPRVLEQSLSMHAQERQGFAFDNFFVNSFGWGGDPNNGLQVRADKSSWYDFRGNFRRDQNFFDYNLLVNPLNPSSSNPDVPVFNSAHEFQTGRRMTDVDLKLLPLSKFSFRLGYSRNNMSGPSWSSIHEGTDALLYQPWNTTINSYRVGADWKLLPHTVLSYDQTLDYYKGDTSWQLASFETGILAGGKSVELGLPFDTQRAVPCSAPILGTGYVNPACNAYLSYSRTQPVRTFTPTERLTLRSSSVRNLELTGSYSYSSADLNMPFDESFAGLITRTRQVAFTQTGTASGQHVSSTAELATIWRISDRFRVSNTFRWDNFRIPGGWNYLTSSLFGATLLSHPNTFNLATCPPPFTAATCPQHSASSPADVTNDFRKDFLKQDSKQDTLEGEYDFTRRITGRVGVRYEQRNLIDNVSDLQLLTYYPNLAIRGCTGVPLVNGICVTSSFDAVNDSEKMHGFAALAGISIRPTNTLRATFDLEEWRANNVFVRIGPRAEGRYRFQTSYTPRPWAVLGGSVNILENSNDDPAVDYRGHNRNYGMTASFAPRERFSVDLAYNYSDFLQNGILCFNDTPASGVVLPVVTSAGSCAALDSGNPLLTNSYYLNDTNFGMGAFMFKPVKRVTTRVGYSITSVDGKAPQFNILQPDGSLHYKYHQPLADLSVDLGHNVSWNTAWNYYQYREEVPVGPTASRYFHANTATIALRYAF